MLTLFTTPKPFRGPFATIQRNALRSWTRLPACRDVFVFGDEAGTAEAAADLQVCHIPAVARNEQGMPLVKSLFEQAQQRAHTPFLAYANADIVFTDDLIAAIRRVSAYTDRFLLIGQRYDVDLSEPIAFDDGWDERLRQQARAEVTLSYGIDYFVFPRTLWTAIPETLVVGRAGWDNWPLHEARLLRAIVIDATAVVTAIHQNHDYSHHAAGKRDVYDGLEAERNYHVYGGRLLALATHDATHMLTPDGLRIRCRSCYPMCVCKPASF